MPNCFAGCRSHRQKHRTDAIPAAPTPHDWRSSRRYACEPRQYPGESHHLTAQPEQQPVAVLGNCRPRMCLLSIFPPLPPAGLRQNNGVHPLELQTFTDVMRLTMARKNARDSAPLQMSIPGMEPPPSAVAASPEPVGAVTATCSGECRRSTQHAVERLRQPDGSLIVRRICTMCDAAEQITISKVVAERLLAVEPPKAGSIMKDTEMAGPGLPIDSECRAADNGPTKP